MSPGGTHRRIATLALLALLVAATVSCGSSKPPHSARPGPVTIDVSAASSLTEAFTTIRDRFEQANPDVKVVLNFGASSELVQQVEAGSPADVLATADQKTMAAAAADGLVGPPVTFARNRLALLVAVGNPKDIRTVADLDDDGVSYVLCAPEVPCGAFGKQITDKAGVTSAPRSLEPNVKAAVTRVTSGEVDAALVYATDVKAAGSRAQGVAIPFSGNVVATYPLAVVKDSEQAEAARSFVDYVSSPAGQRVLIAAGFLRPA